MPRVGADVNLSLSHHLCILGHAIVTVATRGFAQGAVDHHVARAPVEALCVAFELGTEMLNNDVMEHYAIAKIAGEPDQARRTSKQGPREFHHGSARRI